MPSSSLEFSSVLRGQYILSLTKLPFNRADIIPRATKSFLPAQFATCLFKVIAIAALLSLTTSPVWGRGKRASDSTDPGYVLALATANRFLFAWQSGDLASGTLLLSDSVRHSQSADSIEQFFAADSERGFEIGLGSRNHGHYSFPVVLVTTKGNRLARHSALIVLVSSGKNDWVVDKLP